MEIKHDILWRVYLSFIGIVLLSLVVLGRAFYIQRFEGTYWRGLSDSMHQKLVELEAERGTIYSEDGQMLSTSIPYFDIYMDFGAEGLRANGGKRFRDNLDSFSFSLARLFMDKSPAEYKKMLRLGYKNKNRYYLIKKGLSFEQFKTFRQMPLVRLGRNRSGVITEVKTKRLNPYGLLARRTIGLARENAQNVGIERTYDSLLRGTTGRRLVRYIAGGAAVPVEGYEIEPENGNDVYTTLDVNIQDVVENALLKMVSLHEAQSGTAIVMETATGKIKAIANLGRTRAGNYDENLNYALQTTEPGSTIKLATLLAVLDQGTAGINDHIEVGTEGRQYVAVRMITDAERSPKSNMTVLECFAHSSNVGISKLAYHAFAQKPDVFKSYLDKFHLHEKTGIGLVGEEKPVLPRMKRNKEGLHAMLTMSFGYALEVSPLHTLMLYNAVANDGKMMKPYLVNAIRMNGLSVQEFEPTVLEESIANENAIRSARSAMEAVITEGTAKSVFADCPFPVAGKTGTAHVAGGNIKYQDGVYQASFVGYFPANKPVYTCIVVIKTKPHAELHYGGQIAAPVFREIAVKLHAMFVKESEPEPVHTAPDSLNYRYGGQAAEIKNVLSALNLPYRDSNSGNQLAHVHMTQGKTILKSLPVSNRLMPDVSGLTLRDALFLLENMDAKVTIQGRGKVVAQSIPAGTRVEKNQKIKILLH